MMIACCSKGQLITTIIASSINWCATNLKQYDSFFQIDNYPDTTSLNNFLNSQNIQSPVISQDPNTIGMIESDLNQVMSDVQTLSNKTGNPVPVPTPLQSSSKDG